MTATALSIDDNDIRKCGPRLYNNLLCVGNNINVLIEQLDPKALLTADGREVLLQYLFCSSTRTSSATATRPCPVSSRR